MMTPYEIDKAYRSEDTDKLRELLSDFYSSEEFGMWLASPNIMLGGKSALEMIHDGRGEEPIRLAQQLADGAYV